MRDIFLNSFFDGFTLAGILGRVRRPGAASQLFATPHPTGPFDVERAYDVAPARWISNSLDRFSDAELERIAQEISLESSRRHGTVKPIQKAEYGASR